MTLRLWWAGGDALGLHRRGRGERVEGFCSRRVVGQGGQLVGRAGASQDGSRGTQAGKVWGWVGQRGERQTWGVFLRLRPSSLEGGSWTLRGSGGLGLRGAGEGAGAVGVRWSELGGEGWRALGIEWRRLGGATLGAGGVRAHPGDPGSAPEAQEPSHMQQ